MRVFRPTLIAENRAVYGRRSFHFPENLPPQFSIAGSGLPVLGNANFPQYRTDNLYEFNRTWSWIRGRHRLRHGAHLLRYQLDFFFTPNIRGTVTYPSFSDFLFDRNASFSQYAGTGLTPARTTRVRRLFRRRLPRECERDAEPWDPLRVHRYAVGLFLQCQAGHEQPGAAFRFRLVASRGGWLAGNGKLAVRGGYAVS